MFDQKAVLFPNLVSCLANTLVAISFWTALEKVRYNGVDPSSPFALMSASCLIKASMTVRFLL